MTRAPAPGSQTPALVASLLGDPGFPAPTDDERAEDLVPPDLVEFPFQISGRPLHVDVRGRAHVGMPEQLLRCVDVAGDKGYWTYERCLFALADYLQSPGAEPGLGKYQTLSAGKDDWPSSSRITQHATWTAMIAAARHLLQTGEILPLDEVKAKAA